MLSVYARGSKQLLTPGWLKYDTFDGQLTDERASMKSNIFPKENYYFLRRKDQTV